jgi:hypothetical protein
MEAKAEISGPPHFDMTQRRLAAAAQGREASLRLNATSTIRVKLTKLADDGFECLCSCIVPCGTAISLSFEGGERSLRRSLSGSKVNISLRFSAARRGPSLRNSGQVWLPGIVGLISPNQAALVHCRGQGKSKPEVHEILGQRQPIASARIDAGQRLTLPLPLVLTRYLRQPRNQRAAAIVSAERPPCFQAFRLPAGGPGLAPPCMRQRRFPFTAGIGIPFPSGFGQGSAALSPAAPVAWGCSSFRSNPPPRCVPRRR